MSKLTIAATSFALAGLGIGFAVYMAMPANLNANAASAASLQELQHGEQVYGDVCVACHGADAEGEDRIAPPIFAAKNHYSDLTSREDFVAAMSSFILEPTEEAARMPGAIKKFEIMPNLGLSPEEAKAVSEFVFVTDFKAPKWYEQHYTEEHGEAPEMGKGHGQGKGQGKGHGKGSGNKENH